LRPKTLISKFSVRLRSGVDQLPPSTPIDLKLLVFLCVRAAGELESADLFQESKEKLAEMLALIGRSAGWPNGPVSQLVMSLLNDERLERIGSVSVLLQKLA
jgi:hypothetical protein